MKAQKPEAHLHRFKAQNEKRGTPCDPTANTRTEQRPEPSAAMKQTLLLQNLYLGTRNLLYSPIFGPTLTLNNGNCTSLNSPSSASLLKLRFFTSKKDPSIENSTHSLPDHIDLSQTHNKDVPTGVVDVTKKGYPLVQKLNFIFILLFVYLFTMEEKHYGYHLFFRPFLIHVSFGFKEI